MVLLKYHIVAFSCFFFLLVFLIYKIIECHVCMIWESCSPPKYYLLQGYLAGMEFLPTSILLKQVEWLHGISTADSNYFGCCLKLYFPSLPVATFGITFYWLL